MQIHTLYTHKRYTYNPSISKHTYISKASIQRKPINTVVDRKEQHANMIPEVPTSRILLVLATVVAVMALISSWVPEVSGSPLPPPEYDPKRMMCSSNLSDLIQKICVSGTTSLGDAYPNSFGKRRKRDMQNVADKCCKPGGCSFRELMQYCKE